MRMSEIELSEISKSRYKSWVVQRDLMVLCKRSNVSKEANYSFKGTWNFIISGILVWVMRKGVQFVTRCEEIGHRENVVCFTHILNKSPWAYEIVKGLFKWYST